MRSLAFLVLVTCAFGLVPGVTLAMDADRTWAAYADDARDDARARFERDRDEDAHADATASLRLRMHAVADEGLGRDAEDALDPCRMERSGRRRAFCWTSHGRSLRIVLPALAWDVVHSLRPRTLYSYKSVDVRFPPSVKLHLPFNASTSIGYEDEVLGIRLRLRF